MSRVPDRIKLRREYLKKKGKAYSKAAVALACFLGILTLCVGCIGLTYIVYKDPLPYLEVLGRRPIFFTFVAVMGLPFIWIAWYGLQQRVDELARIHPIPPVTPETLPAEEVLVRGAEPPTMTNATLLRTVTESAKEPVQELLRVSNGHGTDRL